MRLLCLSLLRSLYNTYHVCIRLQIQRAELHDVALVSNNGPADLRVVVLCYWDASDADYCYR